MGVRRETVILTLEDHFSSGMVSAAAKTALLDREVDRLSNRAVKSSKSTKGLGNDVDDLGRKSNSATREIDQLSGRLRLLTDAAIVLTPALVATGGVGVAAISGITSELGFLTLGLGTGILAFQGIGDAVKAVNKAALEPTAANLAAARVEMAGLSKEGRAFVREIRQITPELLHLRDVAATNMLPGVTEGLESLETALPKIERIIGVTSKTLGDIAADTGESFASERWEPFLDFLADEAPLALHDTARALGDLTHGLAELWMATTPLNRGFLDWLVEAADDFDNWAQKVDETQGFQEFVAYVEETGPQVMDTLGAIASMFLEVAEAASPLAGPVLKGMEALADVISTIADSDLGTPIFTALTALTLYNRTLQLTATLNRTAFGQSLNQAGGFIGGNLKGAAGIRTITSDLRSMRAEYSRLGAVQAVALSGFSKTTAAAKRARGTIGGLGKSAAVVGGLTVATTGLADQMGLTNTTSLALAGTLAGPWGAAVGAGAGLVADLSKALGESEGDVRRFQETLLAGAGPDPAKQLEAVNKEIEKQKAIFEDTTGPTISFLGVTAKPFEFGNEWRGAQDRMNALKETSAELTTEMEKQALAEDYATSAAGRQSAALQRQKAALADARDAARETSQEYLAFGKNIDDTKVSLNKFIKSQQEQADALRDATTNAGKAADLGLDPRFIQKLLAEGPDGALRLKQLAEATAEQIEEQNKAFRSGLRAQRAQVKEAANLERKVQAMAAKKYRLTIGAETDPALREVNRLINQLKRYKINIPVTASTNANVGEAVVVGAEADGGSVPKDGGPYSDRFLYRLAPGEEIISNRYGQADQFRADRAAGLIPGYADGGRTGRPPGFAQYVRQDLDMKYPTTIRQWNEALKASTKLLVKEKDERQKLLDQADSIRSGIRSNFRTNLFGQEVPSSSVWMSAQDRAAAGTGDVFSTLTGDLDRLGALKGAIRALKSKGLDGAALTELLSQGNLEEIQGLASGNKADVMKYERLFNARERQLALVGNLGASSAVGPLLTANAAQLAEARKFTAGLEKVLAELKKHPHANAAALERIIRNIGPRR